MVTMGVAVTLLPACLFVCLPVARPWALMRWSAKGHGEMHKMQDAQVFGQSDSVPNRH